MKNQNIAAIVVAASLLVGGGAAAYQTSVHEQKCLSYERQIKGSLDNLVAVTSKTLGLFDIVKANPFSAFGLVGEMMSIKPQIEAQGKKLNDTKYAHYRVCGARRFENKVILGMTPKMVQLADNLNQIKSYSL